MSIVSAPVLKIYFGRSLAAEDTKTENKIMVVVSGNRPFEYMQAQKIRFAATQREYVRHDDADFKYLQAEVMVKTFIPLQYIENINNINTVVYDDLPF